MLGYWANHLLRCEQSLHRQHLRVGLQNPLCCTSYFLPEIQTKLNIFPLLFLHPLSLSFSFHSFFSSYPFLFYLPRFNGFMWSYVLYPSSPPFHLPFTLSPSFPHSPLLIFPNFFSFSPLISSLPPLPNAFSHPLLLPFNLHNQAYANHNFNNRSPSSSVS